MTQRKTLVSVLSKSEKYKSAMITVDIEGYGVVTRHALVTKDGYTILVDSARDAKLPDAKKEKYTLAA